MFDKLFKKKTTFQFSDPENAACMTCCHVLDDRAPILYVSHDTDDGMWQFLCGADGHGSEHAKIITLLQAVELDPSVNALYEMPLGVCAERQTVNAEWKPYRMES